MSTNGVFTLRFDDGSELCAFPHGQDSSWTVVSGEQSVHCLAGGDLKTGSIRPPALSGVVEIPTSRISSWATFHEVFAQALGFPEFYGGT